MTTATNTKYYTLPAFNKATRKNSNLATNLATVGLFSAIAACGGSDDSGTSSLAFNPLTAATSFPTPAGAIVHKSADASTASFTIKENTEYETSDISLGRVAAAGEGDFTYSISDYDGYDETYFSIDRDSGELKLKAGKRFDYENTKGGDQYVTLQIVATSADGGTGTYAVALEVENVVEPFALDTFDAAAPINASVTLSESGPTVVVPDVPSTRYDGSSDTATTTLYIREGITTGDELGTVRAQGEGEITYSITSSADFTFGSVAGEENDLSKYIAIDSNGALSLKADKSFVFDHAPTVSMEAAATFTFEVTASSGTESETHTIEVQLGSNYLSTHADRSQGDTETLSTGDDLFQGIEGWDAIDGGKGNDIMYGGAGQDQLTGGDGNDIIYGGDDNHRDTLFGEAGNDILYASQQHVFNGVVIKDRGDWLYGGDGNDIFYGGGDSLLQGDGTGADQHSGPAGADKFVFDHNFTVSLSDIISDFNRTDASAVPGGTAGDRIVILDGNADSVTIDNTSGDAHSIVTYGTAKSKLTVYNNDLTKSDFDFVTKAAFEADIA